MTAYPARDFIVRPIDPEADGPALHAIFGDEESCRYLTRPASQGIAETIKRIGWLMHKYDLDIHYERPLQ